MSIHTELIEPLRPDARAVLCCSGTIMQTSTEFAGLLEACFQVRKSCHTGFDAAVSLSKHSACWKEGNEAERCSPSGLARRANPIHCIFS